MLSARDGGESTMSEQYPEVVARFYDAVYAEVRDGVDNEYYLKTMGEARGPVLEVGVGTGRLLVEALARGVDAYGIDLSPTMIERCRAKLPSDAGERVWVADAVRLETDRRFALVVAPFRVLSHVASPDDQLRLLEAVHGVLRPGGLFVFDLYVPALKLLLEGLPEMVDFDGHHAPGRRLRRVVSSDPADIVRQTNHVRMGFVWDEEDGEHRDGWEFDMRFFFRYELEHLVARSPFALQGIYGDFAETPLCAESREFVVVCRRNAPGEDNPPRQRGE
jgi:SAM-dependent methyltransferase